jgi:hypothetical protein
MVGRILSFASLLLFLGTSNVTAQRLPQWMTKEHFWINLGGGLGGGMGHFMLEGTYQTKYYVFGAHYLTGSDFGGLDRDSISFTAALIAPTAGVTYGGKVGHVSGSAGVGILMGHHPTFFGYEVDPYDETRNIAIFRRLDYSVVALPLNIQAYLHINDFSGLGLTYLQVFSSKKTYGVVNVALSFGSLK